MTGEGGGGGQGLAGRQAVWGPEGTALSGTGDSREETVDGMLPSEVRSLNLDMILKPMNKSCPILYGV